MLNIKTVFVTILLPFISLNVLAIEPKTITKNHGLSHLNDKPSEKITIGIKPFFDPKMRKIIINDLNSLGGFDAVEQNVGTKNIRYIVENQLIQQDNISVIKFDMVDTVTQTSLYGIQQIPIKDFSQSRIVSHKIADRIYELVNTKRDFSLKIKYVSTNWKILEHDFLIDNAKNGSEGWTQQSW